MANVFRVIVLGHDPELSVEVKDTDTFQVIINKVLITVCTWLLSNILAALKMSAIFFYNAGQARETHTSK